MSYEERMHRQDCRPNNCSLARGFTILPTGSIMYVRGVWLEKQPLAWHGTKLGPLAVVIRLCSMLVMRLRCVCERAPNSIKEVLNHDVVKGNVR